MAEGVWEAIRKLFACLWVPEYKSKCHKSKCHGGAVQVMEAAASSSLGKMYCDCYHLSLFSKKMTKFVSSVLCIAVLMIPFP